jgi:hypothetical protein
MALKISQWHWHLKLLANQKHWLMLPTSNKPKQISNTRKSCTGTKLLVKNSDWISKPNWTRYSQLTRMWPLTKYTLNHLDFKFWACGAYTEKIKIYCYGLHDAGMQVPKKSSQLISTWPPCTLSIISVLNGSPNGGDWWRATKDIGDSVMKMKQTRNTKRTQD